MARTSIEQQHPALPEDLLLELATKADIAKVRTELKGDIASLRNEIAEVRSELKIESAKIYGEFKNIHLWMKLLVAIVM